MRFKRLTSLLLALMMIMAFIPAQAEMVDVIVRAAPLVRSADTLDGMVRVYLSSLGNVTALDLTVVGSYSVSGAYNLTLYNGQTVHVDFSTSTGQITVTANGVAYPMGTEVIFRRHQTDGQSALKIAQANRPNNLYPGDLQLLSRSSGSAYKLYPIVHVYIEYYLYGVVPYEMSSSWPAEALKAQAVAARTYTLNRMNGRNSYTYDLVDTSSDQVYNGYVGSETNATRAVDATRGIVIMNDGKLSGTYYTASNGGQTESVANAWGSTAYPYLGVKDDPFDLANTSTNKRRLDIYSTFGDAAQDPTLQSLLTAKAQAQYGSAVTIVRINSVTPHTPKYASPSRLYTKIDFGVTLSTGSSVTLTFDIFGELESPLGMSINSSKNELWYVEKTDTGFILRAARYGHGIGMSQRGAQQMSNMGYTYDQILGFYYEGCERVQYSFTHTILPPVGNGDTPVVATEAPATIAPESSANARVSLAGVGDVLPLRYSPSDTGSILTTISNGSSVNVLKYSSDWTLICYGKINGYVPSDCLVTTGTPPTDSAAAATPISQWATVTGTNSLNLRSGAGYDYGIIGSIPGGAVLPILTGGSAWVQVQYGAQTGWCAVSYLTLSSSYPQSVSGSGSTAMVSLSDSNGSAPLFTTASTSGAVMLYVDHGTQVKVLSNDGTWCRVMVGSVTGYMLESALDFGSTGVEATEPPLTETEMYAVVASDASTLNLRSGPSTIYDVIAEIPRGTTIVVTSYGSEWCAIRWGSLTGYVMTRYLSFSEAATPTPTPAATNVPAGSAALLMVNTSLYTSQSTSSEVQLVLPVGESVTVLSYGENFSLIAYGNMTGYILTSSMQLYQDMPTESPATPTPTPTPSPTPTPTPQPTFIPTNAPGIVMINSQLREEPNTSSAILTTIPTGAEVTVTQLGDSWCKVEYDGTTGWMLTSQLHILEQEATPTSTPTEEPTATPTPAPIAGEEGVVTDLEITHTGKMAWIVPTVSSVNLRQEASTEAEILCEIPANAYLTVYEARPTWSLVVYEGTEGYVFTQYISYVEPVTSLGIRYINTLTDPLALRDAPSTAGKLLTRIPRGSTVTLLEELGDWCRVQYGETKGYCATRYLSTDKPAQHVSDDTPLFDWTLTAVSGWKAEIATGEGGSLFARKWCSLEAPEVIELQNETVVTVLRRGDVWCHISIEGNEGYCLTSQLTLIPPEE